VDEGNREYLIVDEIDGQKMTTVTFQRIHRDEGMTERIHLRSGISSFDRRMLLLMVVAFAAGCPVVQVMSNT
jgi:hypothetical protein